MPLAAPPAILLLASVLLLRGRIGVCRPTLTAVVPKSGSIVSGTHNIRLYCEAFEGSNPIQTVWLQQTAKDREEGRNPGSIPFSNENFDRTGEIIFTSGFNISLYTNMTILELTEEMDRDIIFCATNNRLLANFTLITYKPPRLSDIGEVILRENEELFVDLSEPGSPPAFPFPSNVTWMRGGEQLMNSTDTRLYGYPSIFIGSVLPSDAGLYTLTATNHQQDGVTPVGTDSGSFSLNVLFGAGLSGEDVRRVAVVEGDPVTLECGTDLTGNPLPLIVWRDNNATEVPSGGRFTVSSGRAVVSLSLDSTDREDAGNWTCTAQVYESDSTPLGPPVNVSVELIIVVAPSTPEDLSPYAVGPSWISFSWVQTSRGIPPLSRYMVLVVGGGEERNVTVEGSRTSTTVTNLLPGTTYMIRMVAVSEYGDVQAFSPPSNILITSTAASAPGLVCAEQPTVDGTELVISWSYNHTGGLNVTMTLVEYRAESSQNFIPLPSYMDMSGSGGPPLYSGSDSGLLLDTSASLPLPTAGVLYFFRVIASNEAGSTTVECPSVLTSIGIPATPDAPEVLFKSGGEVSLKLSTNQSGVNDPSVDTFHFILQVENASSGHVEVEVISIAVVCLEGGGVCSAFHFLSYLSPTHSYVITASAGNRYGTSEMSAPLTVPADDDIIDDVTTESNGGLGRTLIVGVSVGGGAALLMMCAVLVIAGCVVRRKSTTGSYDLSNDKKIGSGHSSMPMSSPLHSAPQPPQIHSEEALKRLYEIPVAYGSSPCRENTTFLPPKGPEEGRESRVYEEIDFDKQCQPPDVDFDTTDNTAYNVASFEKPAYINTTTGFSPPP